MKKKIVGSAKHKMRVIKCVQFVLEINQSSPKHKIKFTVKDEEEE